MPLAECWRTSPGQRAFPIVRNEINLGVVRSGGGVMAHMATRLPKAKQDARDQHIAPFCAGGRSQVEAAEMFGVHPRTVHRAVARNRSRRPPMNEARIEDMVKERLASFRVAKEDLAEVGVSARSDAAKLKAITARIDVLNQETDFMMEVGLMPSKGQPFDADRINLAGEFFRWCRSEARLGGEPLNQKVCDLLLWLLGDWLDATAAGNP